MSDLLALKSEKAQLASSGTEMVVPTLLFSVPPYYTGKDQAHSLWVMLNLAHLFLESPVLPAATGTGSHAFPRQSAYK